MSGLACIISQIVLAACGQRFRQLPHRVHESIPTPLHPEINHRAAAAAGEAMPVVALGVDAEAGVVVVVEGTEADGAALGGRQLDILSDEVHHGDGGLDAI